MILYLTDGWDETASLPKVVIILNAQEGLSSLLMVFEAHIADAYLNRFTVVIFSNLCFIVGLVLLWKLDPAEKIVIYWGVAVLIALGEAGKEPTLKAFLADQLKTNGPVADQLENEDTTAYELKEGNIAADQSKEKNTAAADESRVENTAADESDDEKRLDARVKLWWRLFRLLGAVGGAFFWLLIETWKRAFLISAIVMGVSLLIFLSGFRFYHYEKPKGSHIPTVFKALRGSFTNNRDVGKSVQYLNNDDDNDRIPLPRWWKDKAALEVQASPSSAQEQANEVEPCKATQVKVGKRLIRMVPMLATFVVYCTTHATGNTFFFEQRRNLDDRIIGGRRFPAVSFYLIQAISSWAIWYLSNLVISNKWFSGKKKLVAYKVRIGLGLACSGLACVAAFLVEVQRLKRMISYGYYENEYGDINMSVLWLIPQFCLLGLMEGLAEDGLVDFFYYETAESSKSYGPSFNEFAIGLGKFFSIFWILTFHSWFGETINRSRLDKYYIVLAFFSFGNLLFVYTFVSIYVYKDAKGVHSSWDDSLETCFRGCKNAQDPPDTKADGHTSSFKNPLDMIFP